QAVDACGALAEALVVDEVDVDRVAGGEAEPEAEAMAGEVARAVEDEDGGDLVGHAGALTEMAKAARTAVVRVAECVLVRLERDGDRVGRAGARGDGIGS